VVIDASYTWETRESGKMFAPRSRNSHWNWATFYSHDGH
jgi:hypothetical protein